MDKLGQEWRFMDMAYKGYPCCRFFHGQLDCFTDIIEENGLSPEEIAFVRSYGIPFVANPSPLDVQTQIDVQFSLPFCLSLAAHRVPIGADWQDWETIRNPRIPRLHEQGRHDRRSRLSRGKARESEKLAGQVEVDARGRTFTKETSFARGTNFTEFQATDDQLIEKFRHNASRVMRQEKIEQAAERIMTLDKVADVTGLTSLLSW